MLINNKTQAGSAHHQQMLKCNFQIYILYIYQGFFKYTVRACGIQNKKTVPSLSANRAATTFLNKIVGNCETKLFFKLNFEIFF